MVRIPRTLMGAAVGLGLAAGSIEHTEAKDFPTVESTNAGFPFETLAKSEDANNVQTLLEHVNEWAYREDATSTAKDLAKKFPYLFIANNRSLLDSGIPWAHDALLIALQTDPENGTSYDSHDLFRILNVNDSRIEELLEESMEHRYGEIINASWYLPNWTALTANEKRLIRQAVVVLPTKNPIFFFQSVFSDRGKFGEIVPDATERDHLAEAAAVHAIVSGKTEDLETMAQYAESSGDIRAIIANGYGWDQFLDRCSEQVPGTVMSSLLIGRKTFLPLTTEDKRMELYRHAARRAPRSLVDEWSRNRGKKSVVSHENEREFLYHVGEAWTHFIMNDLVHFYPKLLTREAMTQFPQIHNALLDAAEHNPARLLDVLESDPEYAAEIDITEYREIAARNVIAKRAWIDNSPQMHSTYTGKQTLNTFMYFAGLPNEATLTESWFRQSAMDIPATTLRALSSKTQREPWFSIAQRTSVLYVLDKTPTDVDAFLVETKNASLPFDDLELLLGARAKDDFGKAMNDANTLLLKNGGYDPNLAYRLLWILEQSQPYEFAAWVRKNTPAGSATPELGAWQDALTSDQWDGLVAHANRIEADKTYERLAVSTVGTGFRFDATILDDVAGMNYRHRIETTVPAGHPLGPIPGENFISVPMIAFETVATSAPFGAYIDAHASDRLSFVNVCSIAQATWRRLRDLRLEPTPENIGRALQDVNTQWEQIKDIEIFGPHTKLITIANHEERFNNTQIINQLLVGHGGSASQVIFQGKGPRDKYKILEAISTQSTAPVTIVFNGHGNRLGIHLDTQTPITPSDLGDALIDSQNISNTRLVIDSCYSYDYADKVLQYIRGREVDASGLIIITESNQDALGFGVVGGSNILDSQYLTAVNAQAPDRPITVETFRQAESAVWFSEDPSITVGLPFSAGWMTGIEVADAGTE
ncbi:MAG: hypothetical protein AAB473_02875 [Patescibacteria group bacterium]